ncbi:MAG: protein translocase subunit SecF [Patescibacteria group bacterium]|nr:protein translocase subunit SecF [Patescibacteria group bacterium]
MNITKTFKIWFGLSAVLIIVSLFAIFGYGYNTGIDFAGGTILEIETIGLQDSDITPAATITEAYKTQVDMDVAVQAEGGDRYFIRSAQINNDQKNAILAELKTMFDSAEELRFETVDPTIGADVVRKAILAVIAAVIGILLYVAYAFRKIPGEVNAWKFSVAAIVALVHDTVILLGMYAIIGKFMGAEIDSLFITALLTLLGFSVHDTIVTFDRVRENLRRRGGEALPTIINDSVIETVIRSLNTSFTLFVILIAMFFFGGQTLKFFTLAMIIGVVIGTYSSIFIAAPLLLLGHKKS